MRPIRARTTTRSSALTAKTQYVSRCTPVRVVKTETDYAYDAGHNYVPSTVTVDPGGLQLVTTLAYDAQGEVTSVKGPRTDIDTTSYFTYDLDRRNLLAIGPDPDGTVNGNPRVMTRKVYDDAGHLLETDRGTGNASTGSDFALNNWVKESYDPDFNKVLETTGYGSTTTTAVQFTYDGANRLLCTARRMNPVQYGTWPSDACTLGVPGSYGPDRITKTIYDAAGQDRQDIRAFATSAQEVYATHKYAPDGKEIAIADADAGIQIGVSYADALNATSAAAHQTNYAYDGFDRLVMTTYADNTTDQVTSYDSDSNALDARQPGAGQELLTYTYDKLDRMLTKAMPAAWHLIPANTLYLDLRPHQRGHGVERHQRQRRWPIPTISADDSPRRRRHLPGMASARAKTASTYTYDNGTATRST